jgi:hypothetical protein
MVHLVWSPRTASHAPRASTGRRAALLQNNPSQSRRLSRASSVPATCWPYRLRAFVVFMNAQIFVVSSVSVACLGSVDPMHYGRFLFRDRGGCIHLSTATETEHPRCSIFESREATATSCISMGQISNLMDYCRWGQKRTKASASPQHFDCWRCFYLFPYSFDHCLGHIVP